MCLYNKSITLETFELGDLMDGTFGIMTSGCIGVVDLDKLIEFELGVGLGLINVEYVVWGRRGFVSPGGVFAGARPIHVVSEVIRLGVSDCSIAAKIWYSLISLPPFRR